MADDKPGAPEPMSDILKRQKISAIATKKELADAEALFKTREKTANVYKDLAKDGRDHLEVAEQNVEIEKERIELLKKRLELQAEAGADRATLEATKRKIDESRRALGAATTEKDKLDDVNTSYKDGISLARSFGKETMGWYKLTVQGSTDYATRLETTLKIATSMGSTGLQAAAAFGKVAKSMRTLNFRELKKGAKDLSASLKEVGSGMMQAFGTAAINEAIHGVVNNLINMAVSVMDAEAEFRKVTGANAEFARGMTETYESTKAYGVSVEEASKATQSLYQHYTDFTMISATSRKELQDTVAILAEFGISTEALAKGTQNATKMFGMNVEQVGEMHLEIKTFADELGVMPQVMAQEFANAGGQLAKFGDQGVKAFKDLQHAAKITGMEMNKILGITNKFDTFEGAAEQAGKLNAALGGNFVNAMDLMMATDPAERFNMIRDSILDTGLTFDDMSYYQKNFYKDALGLSDVGELALMLSGNMDTLGGATEMTAMQHQEAAEQALQFQSMTEKWQAAIAEATPVLIPLVDALTDLVANFRFLTYFIGPAVAAMVAYKVQTLATAGVESLALIAKLPFIKATWAQNSANVALRASQMGAGAAVLVFVAILYQLAKAYMFGSPSLLVMATYGLAGGIKSMGRSAKASGPGLKKFAVSMLSIGAAIAIAAAGLALLVASFSLLSAEEMGMMVVSLIAFGVAIALLGTFGSAAAPGIALVGLALLTLVPTILAFGIAIALAAGGIALMSTGMTALFNAVDVPKTVALIGLFAVLAAASPLLYLASLSVGYLAIAFGGLALSLSLMKTEKLDAIAQFTTSLSNLAALDSLISTREEIEGIVDAINRVDTNKTITFTNNIEALTDLQSMTTAANTRAAAGVSTTVDHMVRAIAGGAPAAAAGGGGGAPMVRERQPIVLTINGDKMSDWVLEVVGKEIDLINRAG